MSRLTERRRRRERLAGLALALLGVLVLVVAIVALRDPKGHSPNAGSTVPGTSGTHSTSGKHSAPGTRTPSGGRTTPSTRSTPKTAPGTDSASARKLPLVVLNNTTTTGLAEGAAERFRAGGWTVTKYANYQNNIISTCAYYDPDVTGAQASAEALRAQFPTIKRVLPQFSELSSYGSPIVVILTPDYSPD
ncbi:MAG: LytR C-terminal domain-containing protein [Sciscionella sp.]